MRKLIIFMPVILVISSCVSPSVEKLAEEFCECREIQKNQSSLQGEQCIDEWDKKYGKMRLSKENEAKFAQLISDCQPDE
ncbi:MAG: hypothetical protein H6599_11275 [Flavobacteriales bacterium]|nr:hypothetical protein [Flavobacteriales bacterium]